MKKLLILPLILALVACGEDVKVEQSELKEPVKQEEKKAEIKAEVEAELLDPAAVIQAFKDGGLPVGNILIHTSATDPNKLLGRPDGYVASAHFEDTTIEQVPALEGEIETPTGGSIEVWKTPEEAQARKAYIEKVVKQMEMPNLKQYMYIHKTALLRLQYDVLPEEAIKYENILKGM